MLDKILMRNQIYLDDTTAYLTKSMHLYNEGKDLNKSTYENGKYVDEDTEFFLSKKGDYTGRFFGNKEYHKVAIMIEKILIKRGDIQKIISKIEEDFKNQKIEKKMLRESKQENKQFIKMLENEEIFKKVLEEGIVALPKIEKKFMGNILKILRIKK